MSIIKDVNEAHDSLKALSLSLLLAPFWYFSLFLFTSNFYIESDLILKIVFCLIASLLSAYLTSLAIGNQINEKKNDVMKSMILAVFFLILWKSLLMFIVYSVFFFLKKEIYYYWYTIIFFLPIIVLFVLDFILELRKD